MKDIDRITYTAALLMMAAALVIGYFLGRIQG